MKKLLLIIGLLSILFLAGCGRGIVPPLPDDGITYRALIVGIGDYPGDKNDLASPAYSVDRMYKIFNQCRFGISDVGFSVISELRDLKATGPAILNEIASTFSGADNDDVSYFYYTGHGYRGSDTSYLCPADTTSISSLISVNELEKALSAIPGTKVVILDTCHSGGFIGKEINTMVSSEEELKLFNDGVIDIFSQVRSKGLLITNQYKVLTSCSYDQVSWEVMPISGKPYSIFTMALSLGCGYSDYNYPADTNVDNKVSLQEAYLYVKDWVIQNWYDFLQQDVQVYPDGSVFSIIEF